MPERKFVYAYIDVNIPSGAFNTEEEMFDVAIREARERFTTYTIPCEWSCKTVSEGYETVIRVCRKSRNIRTCKPPFYFAVMGGLSGCYMPNSCYHVKINSLRELISMVRDEAEFHELPMRQVRGIGLLDWWRDCRQRGHMASGSVTLPLDNNYALTFAPITEEDYSPEE